MLKVPVFGSLNHKVAVARFARTLATLLASGVPILQALETVAGTVANDIISDAILYKGVEVEAEKLLSADPEALRWVVTRCVAAKARYIEVDERDGKGVRAALNYGHTVGHAVETLSGHSIRHGEAVAIGMVATSKIAVSLGLLKQSDLQRQVALLDALGLPTEAPYGVDEVIPLMKRDKKAEHGSIRLVLPTGMGSEPVVRGVSEAEIWGALEA
jgi:3-dehydroquinate synthase